jgi:hypothetical protein
MWLAAGGVAIKLIELAVNAVERSRTSEKGQGKTELALGIVNDVLSSGVACGDSAKSLPNTPEVQDAYRAYMAAYVTLQNTIAKANGV